VFFFFYILAFRDFPGTHLNKGEKKKRKSGLRHQEQKNKILLSLALSSFLLHHPETTTVAKSKKRKMALVTQRVRLEATIDMDEECVLKWTVYGTLLCDNIWSYLIAFSVFVQANESTIEGTTEVLLNGADWHLRDASTHQTNLLITHPALTPHPFIRMSCASYDGLCVNVPRQAAAEVERCLVTSSGTLLGTSFGGSGNAMPCLPAVLVSLVISYMPGLAVSEFKWYPSTYLLRSI